MLSSCPFQYPTPRGLGLIYQVEMVRGAGLCAGMRKRTDGIGQAAACMTQSTAGANARRDLTPLAHFQLRSWAY